jgi:hypothetical protein
MSDRPTVTMRVEATGPAVYTPATPEQVAAYLDGLKNDRDGGAGYAKELELRGMATKEQAAEMIRQARIKRKLRRANARR